MAAKSEPESKYTNLMTMCKELKLSNNVLQTPMKKVITVKSDVSLIEAFRELMKNNILSAPVHENGKWIGFLDVRDLVSYVNHLYENQPKQRRKSWDREKKESGPNNSNEKSDENKRSHLDRIIDIAALEPTITVRYLARRNPFKPLGPEASLWDAMKLMARRIKRIPVVDENGKLVNIVSQSSVMRLLSNNLQEKKIQSELAKVSASEIGTKEVVSVHKDAVAAEVFKVMSDKNLSGIAVVDSIGTFLCSTQASDLKLYLLKQDLSLLRKPIRQFLAEVRQQELDDLLPNVSVKPSNSLAHVVAKLAVVKMHRVFVANPKEGLRPLGVISISDLLRHIFNMNAVTTTKRPTVRVDGSPSLRPKGSDLVKGMKSMKPLS
mmetsp:Transcript_17417/g.28369  ORF Transcript_17417/g.28369 Transcript_17417/m.28369 type:complete len:379 (-) Transcript_17417:108-1244(-)|eukprot:jgi/Bigna1/127646/aug1.5_g2354